jgi:hypothetical protein
VTILTSVQNTISNILSRCKAFERRPDHRWGLLRKPFKLERQWRGGEPLASTHAIVSGEPISQVDLSLDFPIARGLPETILGETSTRAPVVIVMREVCARLEGWSENLRQPNNRQSENAYR